MSGMQSFRHSIGLGDHRSPGRSGPGQRYRPARHLRKPARKSIINGSYGFVMAAEKFT